MVLQYFLGKPIRKLSPLTSDHLRFSVDTPGFKDTEDTEYVNELMDVLGDEVKEVDAFLIVYRYKDRFTKPFKRTLTMLTKMFGNFWSNVVLVVNFWSFKQIHVDERLSRGVNTTTYSKQLKAIFKNKFDLDFDLPLVFIDTHYNKMLLKFSKIQHYPFLTF